MQKHLDMKPHPSQQIVRQTVAAQSQPSRTKRWSKKQKIIFYAMLAVGIMLIVLAMGWKWFNSPAAMVDHSTYRAVYLQDDKAYFGKLQILSDGSYALTDVYYPQASQQNGQAAGNNVAVPSAQLVKFGTEVLGGQDKIVFNKPQVSYWVNLKASSKVVQAIENYQK